MITHSHPLGIEGAILIAQVTAAVLNSVDSPQALKAATSHLSQPEFLSRLQTAQTWLESGQDVSRKEIVRQLGHGIAAHKSCVTAVYLALRFRDQPFITLQQFIASCGGDVDTIGAMAGAIWGTANGIHNLPADWLNNLEQQPHLHQLALTLHQKLEQPES